MSLLQKILDKTGVAFLFETPVDEEQEVQKIVDEIEQFIIGINKTIDDDIEQEPGKSAPYSARYVINDQQGKRIELPPFSLVSLNSIRMTDGYQQLKLRLIEKACRLELREINIDRNGIDTIEKLDDQLDDFARYFVIQVSCATSNKA
ncbi:MAG: hypothetical protein IMF14_05195 [Proteobacteria bacterium]|nr:hypothetical protein [Pseudomonadota bacterium]